MRRLSMLLFALVSVFVPAAAGLAADAPSYNRTEDVIYGRKFGTALTLDVFRPKEHANGLGVVWAVSGGWYSAHDIDGMIPGFAPLLQRGYTVFPVVHGSQPKFAIPEILQDMNRAVRFIRFHAKDYGIDPDRLGMTGGSAGGHLSLMQGDRRGQGRPERQGPGRPRVQPDPGGGVLFSADRLPQLRQGGRDRRRPRDTGGFPGRVRLS